MFAQTATTKLLPPPRRPFASLPEAEMHAVPCPSEPILHPLESPAAGTLIRVLDRDIKTLRRGRVQVARLLFLTSLFFLLAHSRFLFGWECRGALSALLLVCCTLLMQRLMMRYALHLATRRRIKNELLLLQKYASAHRIDMLIDAMRYGDGEASLLAQRLLVETLPHVSEGYALTRAHHAALCRALHGTNANLILAILAAFKKIGIPQSARAVQRMMYCPVWLADATQIEKAAQACYLAMQERAKRQAMTETYLRPGTPDGAQILLRPVIVLSSEDGRDARQLVRAGMEGEARPL